MRRTTPSMVLVLFALIVTMSATAFTAASAAARPWLGVYTQEVTGPYVQPRPHELRVLVADFAIVKAAVIGYSSPGRRSTGPVSCGGTSSRPSSAIAVTERS